MSLLLSTFLTAAQAAHRARLPIALIAHAVRTGDLREFGGYIRCEHLDMWAALLRVTYGGGVESTGTTSVPAELVDDRIELLPHIDQAV